MESKSLPVKVRSPNTTYDAEHITAHLSYEKNEIHREWDKESASFVLSTTPKVHNYTLRTKRKVPKVTCALFCPAAVTCVV